MMNHIVLSVVVVAVTALVSIIGASAQDFKIGIVDMKEVFSAYQKNKDADQDLNERKAAAKQHLDQRKAQYESLISRWQEMQKMIADPQLDEVLRDKKQREANDVAAEAKALEREMAEFRSRSERALQEQVMRTRKGIYAEIKKVVDDKARRDNYGLVFDKSGEGVSGVPFLLYSKDADDVSEAEENEQGGAVSPFGRTDEAGMFAFDSRPDGELEWGRGQSLGEGEIHDASNLGTNTSGNPQVFEVTEIERSTNGISLTWNSRQGREYSVEYGLTLEEAAWIEVADGVLGLEDVTTFVDDDPDRARLPDGYYRVREK